MSQDESFSLNTIFLNIECHSIDCLIRWQRDRHAFSRPHGALVPFSSHSDLAQLSIPLYRPIIVLLVFLVIFPPNIYSASWCLTWVPFALITCPNNLSFLSSSVSYFPASGCRTSRKWIDFNVRLARSCSLIVENVMIFE